MIIYFYHVELFSSWWIWASIHFNISILMRCYQKITLNNRLFCYAAQIL